MKTKADKKVNKIARKLNKQLAADVFGDRFWVRQAAKARIEGVSYYLYELRDRLEPERNVTLEWENEFGLMTFDHLALKMNTFIVESDFWSLYRKGVN